MRVILTGLAALLVATSALAQPPAPAVQSTAAPLTLEACATLAAGRGPAAPGAPGAAAGRGGPPAAGAPVAGRGGPPAAGAPGRGPAAAPLPTTSPRPRDDNRHKCFLTIAKAGNIDLLFVGDSITDWWQQTTRGKPEWDRAFVPLKAANFGIGGDTTQGVLWRMQNGELKGFKAKVIVLMLGTNNINSATPAEIAAGDAMIVREFRKQQPQAKVLVLGVFPRSAAADNPLRGRIKELNYHLSQLADNRHVFYLDIGDKFLAPDGTLPTDVMPDGLHPNLRGYGIWAEAIMPKVKELLGS